MKKTRRTQANASQASIVTPRKIEVIGVVPAAGQGKRVAPMPCSKELFPVGFRCLKGHPKEFRPKVVTHYLLEKYRQAGITKAYIIIRDGKWDIPAYFADGSMLGMHVAYMVIGDSEGPPATVDRAYPFLRDKLVAFGFPDILFGPDDVFERLLRRQEETGADVVLGLYPAHNCRVMDMVEMGRDGRVRNLYLKPRRTNLRFAWLCGVWTPKYTDFMHSFLAAADDKQRSAWKTLRIDAQGDLPIGAVLREAIRSGLHVEGIQFSAHRYIDIGTPQDLIRAVRRYSDTKLRGS